MPNSPSIGRSSGTLPLTESHTAPSPATDSGQAAGGAPHAGPQADAKLNALAGSGGNASTAAAGKGTRASFAAKVSSAATAATSAAAAMPQKLAAGMQGRAGRMGAFSQGAANTANGATGMAEAGLNVLGGVMQLEQAAVNQIAELMKQGAHNIEEASKG